MVDRRAIERIDAQPAVGLCAARLLVALAKSAAEEHLLAQSLAEIAQCAGATYVAAMRVDAGQPLLVGEFGVSSSPPARLMAEALDRETVVQQDSWCAVPLIPGTRPNEVLLVYDASEPQRVDGLAAALGSALAAIRGQARLQRHVSRLETILAIAHQWNQANEMEPLLVQMAEAATRFLKAERASIFLWDRPNKRLLARPALGVEQGELDLPDDVGVVGQVIRSRQPQRVDAQFGQEKIDRQVDRALSYQTRTLLCVPLLASNNRVLGAFEVLNRHDGNFDDEDEAALVELAAHAAVALENTQQWENLAARHRQSVEQAAQGVQLIGESPAMEALRSTIRRVADTDLAILILGENGTGKEVVSQQIHYLSSRRDEPFVAVNCAALTETLLESELFGHEKGAFTDAHEARQGKFELASGGTLFLDEIGDLSLSGQAKLLRVLEEKVVVRVGGSKSIHTDARVLAATNQNLAEMVRDKRFRQDLYYRLNVVTMEMPPLRDRGNDILLLAEFFLQRFCQAAHRAMPQLSAGAKKRLLAHRWPGNVRELRNLMERLAYLTQGDDIQADELAFILSPADSGPSVIPGDLGLSEATRQFQVEYIRQAINDHSGNMSQVAKTLGLHRSNLYRKMRQLGMSESPELGDGDEPEES